MDEGSGYCGSSGGIESVSDAEKQWRSEGEAGGQLPPGARFRGRPNEEKK